MPCRGFMNAVNCLHFGVRQYVHIAVTKVVFSSVSQIDRWLTHVDLPVFILWECPFPPLFWIAGDCHFSTVWHFFLSTFEWSWHRYLSRAGPFFFFSWEFWQSWWGRKKKEQRRQKEKISLSFCGPLPSTRWSREVLVAATWTGTQNARDGWSRRTERRERQKLLSVLCYPSHWLRSEGPQAYAAAGSELPPTEDHAP